MSKPFEQVTVVGTGLLGTQIAMLSAHAGYKVKVYDTREGAFDETYDKLSADLKARARGPDNAAPINIMVWPTNEISRPT